MRATAKIPFLLLLTNLLCYSVCSAQHQIGEVFFSQGKGGITELAVRTSVELAPGMIIQIGKKEFAVVGLKQRQDNTGFYFEATIPETTFIKVGEPVYWVPIGEFKAPPEEGKSIQDVLIVVRKTIPFSPKKIGKVTAVEPPKVLVDKGSLHEVRERDIFAVYDSSGRYKGQIEVRAIGDLQAVAYTQSDKLRRNIQEGDKVVHLGQRKQFAFGLMVAAKQPFLADSPDFERSPIGGGLLWDLTFSKGWHLEFLIGPHHLGFDNQRLTDEVLKVEGDLETVRQTFPQEIFYALPVTLRKSFFYPRWFSPYIGAGIYVYAGRKNIVVGKRQRGSFDRLGPVTDGDSWNIFPMPQVSGGVELFPGRFFRPRIEVRYFIAPDTMKLGRMPNSLYVGIGFTTAWAGP